MAEAQTNIEGGIRITGKLADDAHLGFTPGEPSTAVLTLMVTPAKGLPYVVRQTIGTDPSAHIAAQAKLRVLRRGDEVSVYAEGLRAQSDHGVAALRAVGVTHVLPISSALTRRVAESLAEER